MAAPARLLTQPANTYLRVKFAADVELVQLLHKTIVGLKSPRLPDVIYLVQTMARLNSLAENVAALCYGYGALVPRAISRHSCREENFGGSICWPVRQAARTA